MTSRAGSRPRALRSLAGHWKTGIARPHARPRRRLSGTVLSRLVGPLYGLRQRLRRPVRQCDLNCPRSTEICQNGVLDPGEADVDCGGTRSAVPNGGPCADGLHCFMSTDCRSGVCAAGTCASPSCQNSPSCQDGVRNGLEFDVDCGGASCSGDCTSHERCFASSDCQSGICSALCQQPTWFE